MMWFIARTQITAAVLALGLVAGIARAADSKSTSAPAPAAIAPADAAASADAVPPAEAVPPGVVEPAPIAAADSANTQVVEQPAPQAPGFEAGPQCDTGFHPLAPLRDIHPLAPLRDIHPLAPLRERFAEAHTAPARFPGCDGEPRCVGLPRVRAAAGCACAHPHLAGPPGPQVIGPPGPEIIGQPEPAAIGPVDPNAVIAADGGGGVVPAAGEYVVEPFTRWYDGAEYLLIRPHQTYDSAYEISPNGATGPTVENVNFNSGFGNAVRLFVGYATTADESLRFSYTYMFNDTLRQAAVPTGASILSPLGSTLFPGDSLAATQHLLVNLWDLEDVRKLNLPWLTGPGDCKACPSWDVNWSWGIRIAQIDEAILDSATGPDGGGFNQKSSFIGAGPRLGIDVHRQLGHSKFAAYVAADAALLVGDQHTYGATTPSGSHGVQSLPNFDLELGLSWRPTCNLDFTAGYLFETFGDAVQLSEASSLALLAPPQASSLSYDGFFFRGEFKY